jgi:hypothetical protein
VRNLERGRSWVRQTQVSRILQKDPCIRACRSEVVEREQSSRTVADLLKRQPGTNQGSVAKVSSRVQIAVGELKMMSGNFRLQESQRHPEAEGDP